MTGSMVMHRPVEGPVAAGDGGGRPGSLDRQLLLATSETRSDDVASSNVELGQLHGSATAGVQGAAEDKASTRKSTPGVESLMPFSQLLPSLVEVPALTLLSNPPSTAPSNSDAEASLCMQNLPTVCCSMMLAGVFLLQMRRMTFFGWRMSPRMAIEVTHFLRPCQITQMKGLLPLK